MLNPDLPPVHITPFDAGALRDAFSLRPGQIPGFDAMIWETEVDAPRRKVRPSAASGKAENEALTMGRVW